MEVRFFPCFSIISGMCIQRGWSIGFRRGNKAEMIPILTPTTGQRGKHGNLCLGYRHMLCGPQQ